MKKELLVNNLEQIKERAKLDQALSNNSLWQLASVTVEKGVPDPDTYGQDPLLFACKLVAASQNLTIKKPPEQPAKNDYLASILRASGIKCRKVYLEPKWWTKECGPLLAFSKEDKKPVALIPNNKGGYTIIDTKFRTRTKVTKAEAETLDLAYSLYRPFPNKKITKKELLKFAFTGSAKDISSIVLSGVGIGILGVFIPYATAILFDSVIPATRYNQLTILTLALIISALSSTVLQIARGYALIRITTRTEHQTLAAVWDRLIDMPVSFFKKYTVGELAHRANGLAELKKILSQSYISILLNSIFSVFSLAILFYFSVKLTVLALILLGVLSIFSIALGWAQIKPEKELVKVEGELSGKVLQFITGISKLRLAAAEVRAFAQWSKLFTKQRKLSFRSSHLTNIKNTFFDSFEIFSSIIIFTAIFMFWRAHSGLSAGLFLAFNAAFSQLFRATRNICNICLNSLSLVPLYERTKPILETMPEVNIAKKNASKLSGKIEVNQVSFKYQEDSPKILDNVSLNIKPQEFVALVGSSGSGKSTIMRLLMGFEEPLSGTIYFDNQNLDSLDIMSVRQNFGVVLQKSKVMAGDIFSNIIGAGHYTIEDAWIAAEQAGLADDIKKMPMGMHTFLIDGATTLSGGQLQRLMIARALVRKPQILFFDEATSALDNKTQAIVTASLDKLKITRLVVAHRLSTIINADKIFVLESGRIVQSGTYEQLNNVKGTFSDLVKRQQI
jgi:NHLM bacteriocin system ABC transporter ATP-binding protein